VAASLLHADRRAERQMNALETFQSMRELSWQLHVAHNSKTYFDPGAN